MHFCMSSENCHSCDLLKMWAADPSVPVCFDSDADSYSMAVSAHLSVTLYYCPFCGKGIKRAEKAVQSSTDVCQHMINMASVPGSFFKLDNNSCECCLVWHEHSSVRIFYCPICGATLPVRKRDDHLPVRFESEVNELRTRFMSVKTIDDALREFGAPELDHGLWIGQLFPDGVPCTVGHKRMLVYENLAKTVSVTIYELLDGQVKMRLMERPESVEDR